ncbi:MAG: pantoate--beta-alanine ligase, partial [Candidatus Aerophobetes bacterium]|nr:pantoate--beta-alanine ligase [Candidatus Aerophobetes bacterium]
MRLIKKIDEMEKYVKERKGDKIIGLVPTMGYLHEGHLSLIRKARKKCDEVIVSIFVNPTQFGGGEDYQRYPRDIERDIKLSEREGIDIIFAPSVEDMYPENYSTFVQVEGKLSSVLEGASRLGHFKGVCTVLTKLFNIINPNLSFFGEKDYQQALIVKKMVKDLNIPTQIVLLPTVREKDGLAISSRNSYFNERERKAATILYKSLKEARKWIKNGERDPSQIVDKMRNFIAKEPLTKIDYIAVVNSESLEEVKEIKKGDLIALAVYIGKI